MYKILSLNILVLGILFNSITLASPICEIEESNGFFEDEVYIIDEFNFYQEISFFDLFTYTSKQYSKCDNGCKSLAELNANVFASDYLWEEIESTQGIRLRWSCGGDISCNKTFAKNVQCRVEVGDCDALFWKGSPYIYTRIREIYELECLGDIECEWENKSSAECCKVSYVKKN